MKMQGLREKIRKVIAAPDFNLDLTLNSGQVFGFAKDEDGFHRGIIAAVPVRITQEGDELCVEIEDDILEEEIRRFFDLDQNLSPLYETFAGDQRLASVGQGLRGLRVIKQDPWEALACFIISSNNNIKRIQGIRKNLSRSFCDSDFLFPKAELIAKSKEQVLRALGLGYRAPFLLESARRISNEPLSFDRVRGLDYEEGKARLMQFPGVGEKVADCVLLFGFQKYEAFPVDVWILRVMRKLYFRNRRVSEQKVRAFARKRWGQYAGYLQQYLYQGARSGILSL